MSAFLDFPIALDAGGALRTTDADEHIRDLVLQVLLTEPGERVNLPDFGCGVKRLVFAPDSDVLRATTRFLITQNLQHWLGDRIVVEQVDVSSAPEEGGHGVLIEIGYVVRATQRRDRVGVAL
jgi:phage baseplate assembly protein W